MVISLEQVFDLIFDLFEWVVIWLNQIPVFGSVSLFDFSVGIIVMSIIIVAFVPTVSIGSTDFVTQTLFEREQAERQAERALREEEREIKEYNRQIDRSERERYNLSYEKYKSDMDRRASYKARYKSEKNNNN